MGRSLWPFGWILWAGVVSTLLMACATTAPISPELAQCMARTDRFVSSDKDTVLDTCTQLMWMAQDYRNLEGKAPVGREIAWGWANIMNEQRYANYSDWRLPSPAEYQSLYTADDTQQSYRASAIHYPAVFAGGGGEWYWTSEVAEWGDPPTHMHYCNIFSYKTGSTSIRYTDEHSWKGKQPNETTGSVRLVRGPVGPVSGVPTGR